jgi:alpha-tubulin suppressor-like RCC1 family protein
VRPSVRRLLHVRLPPFPIPARRALSVGLLCGPTPGLAGTGEASLTADDLRELVARDDRVLVRVELAAGQPSGDAGVPAVASEAQDTAVEDLLFALPEGSYADVERLADGAALVLRVDAAGFDGLLASSEVAAITPAGMPAAMRRLAAGFHSLALQIDSSLWAWGYNISGQVGDGTTTNRLRPVPVMNGVAAVASGDGHTLALATDGSLWAWGYNGFGQLGDGTTTDRSSPVAVMSGVAAVAGGGYHTLALRTDGSLWAWGHNEVGQLGDGTTTDRSSPVAVMTGVAAVAAAGYHTLALKTDGSLWAWGNNHSGQVGDGTTTNRLWPVPVLTGVAAVAGGGAHTLALKSDGSLWAWGNNGSGQLGDGTRTGRLWAVAVLTGVAAVAAGIEHTLALKRDGSLWTWGANGYGQLGDGTTTRRLLPVPVTVFRPTRAATPSELAATVASTARIDLRWRDNSSNETGFRIERKIGTGAWSQIATVGANVTAFASTGLKASTTYRYRVRAFNTAGTSAYSNTVTTRTAAPAAPASLTATAASTSRIDLAWSDKSTNETGFRIERRIGTGTWSQIAAVGANVTSFASTGLRASTTYGYRVRAFNGIGTSAYSNTASAKTQ